MGGNNEILMTSFIIVIACGIVLTLYHFVIDPVKNIERHYFKTSKISYCIFRIAYVIILFSCIFSLRYIVLEGFKYLQRTI